MDNQPEEEFIVTAGDKKRESMVDALMRRNGRKLIKQWSNSTGNTYLNRGESPIFSTNNKEHIEDYKAHVPERYWTYENPGYTDPPWYLPRHGGPGSEIAKVEARISERAKNVLPLMEGTDPEGRSLKSIMIVGGPDNSSPDLEMTNKLLGILADKYTENSSNIGSALGSASQQAFENENEADPETGFLEYPRDIDRRSLYSGWGRGGEANVDIAPDLSPDRGLEVRQHELSHILDHRAEFQGQMLARIAHDPVLLKQLIAGSIMGDPRQYEGGRERSDYTSDPEEMIARNISAYMRNRDKYIEVAPDIAALIREVFNSDDALNKVITFSNRDSIKNDLLASFG